MTPPPTEEIDFYIVEHPLRGIIMTQEPEPTGNSWETHWAWSKPRTEGKQFHRLSDAKAAISRLPVSTQAAAYVLFHTRQAGWHTLEE